MRPETRFLGEAGFLEMRTAMPDTIHVSVAWPYANGDLHVGHLAGDLLPADIFARYHRLKGNRVLMVSGSDSHGTPITVEADKRGIPPRQLFEHYHLRHLEAQRAIGISYDLYTHTDTENHHRVAQGFFTRLHRAGHLFREKQRQLYSEPEGRFLPDRYVEGTCPVCGFGGARGDQCDNCGSLLDALDLIDPRSKTDGSKPVIRETEHFFLNLPAFSERLDAYLSSHASHWRPNVIHFARNLLGEGLKPRSFTRDVEWGVSVPLAGWEHKRIYVWFEALMGYLSASIEWAHNTGQPEAWKDWWCDPQARIYNFLGKDNIPFHTVYWQAQLLGVGTWDEGDPRPLNLPYDVAANEFMNVEGAKFSKSRNWAIWLPDVLGRYDPDALRYYVAATMPETRDSEFAWGDFVRRNNDELVATWGNLVNRVLSFAYRHWEGRIPDPEGLRPEDTRLLQLVEAGFPAASEHLEAVRLRPALSEAIGLAGEVNRYLDQQGPWFAIKSDRLAAAKTIYTALRAIDSLKVLLAPFLPFSAERLHRFLGFDRPLFGDLRIETFREAERQHQALVYDASSASGRWQPSDLLPGQALRTPEPLYLKLENEIVETEGARLGK
jgi:methionyl-tRNA synthetase